MKPNHQFSDRALPPFPDLHPGVLAGIVDVSVSGTNPAGRKPPVSELQKMQCIKKDDARTSGLLSSAVSRATTCRTIAAPRTIDTWAIAAWTVDTRAIAAWAINSGPESGLCQPCHPTGPPQPKPRRHATPVPARAAPTVIVPTITPTLADELGGLYDSQLISPPYASPALILSTWSVSST
jgi:hypothetical protein